MLGAYPRLRDHLEKLHAFYMIGKLGSFSKAAKLMHSSQAALSHSMKVLEGALDLRLFHRNARGVTMTEAGEILYVFAQELLGQIDRIEDKMKNPGIVRKVPVKVGIEDVLPFEHWPSWMESYQEKTNGIEITLSQSKFPSLISGLMEEKLQAVVTVNPVEHAQVQNIPFTELNFHFYTSSPETAEKAKSFDSLKKIPILTYGEFHMGKGQTIRSLCLKYGLELSRHFEMETFEGVMRMIEAAPGLAFLPESLAEPLVQRGRISRVVIKDLPEELKKCPISISVLKSRGKDAVLESFVKEILGVGK